VKVDLLIEPSGGFHNYDLGPRPVPIKRMVPWYRTRYRRVGSIAYVHRVRSAQLHFHKSPEWKRETSVSVRLWCGNQGSLVHGELYAEPPDHSVVCATCEARALGAGFPSSVLLANRPIRFSPRHRYQPEWTVR